MNDCQRSLNVYMPGSIYEAVRVAAKREVRTASGLFLVLMLAFLKDRHPDLLKIGNKS